MQIKDILSKIIKTNGLNRIPQEYKDEFTKKVLSINLQREQISAYLLIAYVLFNLLIDIFYYRYKWNDIPAYENLFYIHIISIFVFTGYVVFCHFNDNKNMKLNKILNYSSIILFLLYCEIHSLNAQFTHGQISAFIISLFAIASLLILSNFECLFIISLSYLSFNTGLLIIQHDPVKLSGHIINSLSLAICAYVVSRLSFSMFVKDFLANKVLNDKTQELDTLNSNLEKKNRQLKTILKNKSKTDQLIKDNHEQIIKAEKEKNDALEKSIIMKDEFLSLISHEFKTPLTVINSAIQTMELVCKKELSDKARGFLNKIRQNSNRQMKLVNNLLDITRMNAGHLKVNKKDIDIVYLTKSITESIRIFAEQKNINVSFSSTLGRKVIGIDEEKYERILLNLLSNAIKFTPGGRSVAVRISQKIAGGKCKVCIQVIDKGIGIPFDKQELIFERFGQVDSSLTRQAEGTGIGLYLVRMLVEMMGGEIVLESKVDVGSTFTLLLPVTKEKETPIEQMIKEINDNRLIRATAIEFSDV